MEKLTLPISVLDLVPILEGQTATDAFVRARELAKHVDEFGYTETGGGHRRRVHRHGTG